MLMHEAANSARLSRLFTRWLEAGVWMGTLAAFVFVYAVSQASGSTAAFGAVTGNDAGAVARALLLGIAFVLGILCSMLRDGPLQRLACWAPMRYLGNMSYSYYLIHGLTLKGMALVTASVLPSGPSGLLFILLCVAGFAATWCTSTMLFVLIEKPLSLRPARAAGRREAAAPAAWLAAAEQKP